MERQISEIEKAMAINPVNSIAVALSILAVAALVMAWIVG